MSICDRLSLQFLGYKAIRKIWISHLIVILMSKSCLRNKCIKIQLQEYTYCNIFKHFLHNSILGIANIGNVDHLLSKSLQGKQIHFHPTHTMTYQVDKELLFYPICLDIFTGWHPASHFWKVYVRLVLCHIATNIICCTCQEKLHWPNASVSMGRSNAEHFWFPIFIYNLFYSKTSNYRVRTLDKYRRKVTWGPTSIYLDPMDQWLQK